MDAKTHKICEFESSRLLSLAKEHYVECPCSQKEPATRLSLLPTLERGGVPRQKGSDALGEVRIRGLSHRHRNQLGTVTSLETCTHTQAGVY